MPKRPKLPRPRILGEFEPALCRLRRDGWTPKRQRAFIDALAEGRCVRDACKTVGMSPQSAYALRRVFEGQAFRFAWDAALDYAVRNLGDAVLSRAIHGVPVPHYYKPVLSACLAGSRRGEQVGEHRRYNDGLAMFLLRYRNPILYGKINDTKDYGAPDEYFAVHLEHMANKVENGVENIYEARHDLDGEEDDTP